MIGFVHNKFKLTDPGTWMAPLIRGVLSQDGTVPGKLYYNHCIAVEEIHGRLYVIEAGWNKYLKKAEVIIKPFDEWKKGRPEGSYVIFEPDFYYDKDIYIRRLLEAIGKPYDFNNIICQLYKLRTDKWIGNVSTEKFQCAKLISYALQFEDWHRIDTEECYHRFKTSKKWLLN
jgi:hypothetical protein